MGKTVLPGEQIGSFSKRIHIHCTRECIFFIKILYGQNRLV